MATHKQVDSTASIDELLDQFDISGADLAAFGATRGMWAGATATPDARASLDHLVAVLSSLHTALQRSPALAGRDPRRLAAQISVHDAIGWI